jgi:hypothetical protein
MMRRTIPFDPGPAYRVVQPFIGQQNGILSHRRGQILAFAGSVHSAHFENIGEIRVESCTERNHQL